MSERRDEIGETGYSGPYVAAREQGVALARDEWPHIASYDALVAAAHASYAAQSDRGLDDLLWIFVFASGWMAEVERLVGQGMHKMRGQQAATRFHRGKR